MSNATMIGMNPDEVEDLGRLLQTHASSLRSIHSRVEGLVRGVIWVGADAGMFKDQWWPEHARRLLAVAADLDGLGRSAANNAAEQRQVSDESGSAPPGMSSPGPGVGGMGVGSVGDGAIGNAPPVGRLHDPLTGSPEDLEAGFIRDWRGVPGGHDQWQFRYNPSGNCVSYVAWRINQLAAERGLGENYLTWAGIGGTPVPGGLGNAESWGERAAAIGFPPGPDPQPGAVAWWDSSTPLGSYGHVGVVRSVDPVSGTIVVEESAWGSSVFELVEYTPGHPRYPTGFMNVLP